MNKWLVIQSIGPGSDDRFVPYMELQEPIHREWCENMGADYRFFRGLFEHANPTWNRFPMMLEAFAQGYEKVVWLDADTLVVRQDRNIFTETPDDVPFVMTRVSSTRVSMPWRDEYDMAAKDRTWDVFNDGVLVANNMADTIEAIEWTWAKRRSPQERWHIQNGMWELNWLLDWVLDHPDDVRVLDFRWNWQPFGWTYDTDGREVEAPPIEEACLLAWHGLGTVRGWPLFKAAYDQHYGART